MQCTKKCVFEAILIVADSISLKKQYEAIISNLVEVLSNQ